MPIAELDKTIEKIQRDLFNYCIALVENKTTAEDLVQDTWLEFLQNFTVDDIKIENKPLLIKIARCNCLDYIERDKGKLFQYRLAAGEVIYEGEGVYIRRRDGCAVSYKGKQKKNYELVGFALKDANNSNGKNGDVFVSVWRNVEFIPILNEDEIEKYPGISENDLPSY